MTRPAARYADLCTGHSCYPSRPNNEGSPDVFINDRNAHRRGDSWEKHCCSKMGCHGAITIEGSSNVFVNDIPLAGIKDDVSCGSKILTGSSDVWVSK
jgi:uncharacterized Zn-binding protein involved in type VI secretion